MAMTQGESFPFAAYVSLPWCCKSFLLVLECDSVFGDGLVEGRVVDVVDGVRASLPFGTEE